MKKFSVFILAAAFLLCAFACKSDNKGVQPEEPSSYGVKIEDTVNGAIDVGGKYLVEKGGSLEVRLVPDSGYETEKAYYTDGEGKHELDASKLPGNTFTVTDISSDILLGAVFKKSSDKPVKPQDNFKITTSVIPDRNGVRHGALTVDRQEVEPGEEAVFTVAPDTDYRVGVIKVSAPDGSGAYNLDIGDAQYGGRFTLAPDGDVIVSASFEAITEYNVTVAGSGEGGSVVASSPSVAPGGSVTITVSPSEHYVISALTVNGRDVTDKIIDGKFALYDVHENIAVEYEFALEKHTVTLVQTQHGRIEADSLSVSYGGTVTVTCTPDSGFTARNLVVNGVENVDVMLNTATVRIYGDVTITAVFLPEKQTINLSGKIFGYGSGSPFAGIKLSVKNTADDASEEIYADEAGCYDANLIPGEYELKVSAAGFYVYEENVILSYDDVERDIALIETTLDVSGSGMTAFGQDGENLRVSGISEASAVKSKFVSSYAVIEGIAKFNAGGKVGATVISGGYSASLLFGNEGYSFGGKVYEYPAFAGNGNIAFRVIKHEEYVYLYIYDAADGEYRAVNSFKDSALSGNCAYGFASLSEDGNFNAEIKSVCVYADLKLIDECVYRNVTVERNAFGSVAITGVKDGRVGVNDVLTLSVRPYEGYLLDYVTLCGHELSPLREENGGYEFEIKGFMALDTVLIEVNFIVDPQPDVNSLGEVSDGLGGGSSFDTSLFYRNDLEIDGADPGVMYVSEEEDPVYGGWFYMAVTGGGGSSAYPLYRSRDLSSWYRCGAADGNALELSSASWSEGAYWAPELIRDPESGKYFIYFSAKSKKGNSSTAYIASERNEYDRLYIGIGISDTPLGPYRMVTAESYYGSGKTTNLNGEALNESTPPVNFGKNFKDQLESMGDKYIDSVTGMGIWPSIDVSPFFTESGDFYIYFSQHTSSAVSGNHIWALKMKDMVTPDWSTLTKLASPNWHEYTGKAGSIDDADWKGVKISNDAGGSFDGNINEGTFLIENEGKFYLTYSPFGYGSRRYSIMQAVGDSPLGPFTKLSRSTGNPVIGIGFESDMYDFMSGAGHHSFVKAGDEIFAVYHAFYNPVNNNENGQFMGRAIAADRVQFVESEHYDFKILQGNGPTYSLQPLPAVASGYSNIVSEAEITATNASPGTLKYLSDYRFVYQPYDKELEFEADSDSEITIDFKAPREIRSVMVYSSYQYDYALERVSSIKLIMADGSEKTLEGLSADENSVNREKSVMRPGGAVIADFSAVKVKKIIINVRSQDKYNPSGSKLRIGDIVVLGRTDANVGSDKPVYSNANGSVPDDVFRIDGLLTEPELLGRSKYVFVDGGVKIEASSVFTDKGAYFYARAYDDRISWTAKNKFTKNTHFKFYFGLNGGGYKEIYVDPYNHKLFNSRVTTGAALSGRVNSGATESFTAEAFVSWEELGFSSPYARIRFLPAYYRVVSPGENTSGDLLLPSGVAVSVPNSYPSFTAGGYEASGSSEAFGSSIGGDVLTDGVTLNSSGAITSGDGRQEAWYAPGYADNFSFSVSASAGSGATGGITLSFGGSRLDFPFELSQAAKLKVIKASDTVMAVSGDDILYAYSLPSYAGACAVGVYSDASSISFSHPDYTVFKDKFSALAASPAGSEGNYLPAISVSGAGRVIIPEPIPEDGDTAKAYFVPDSGSRLHSVRLNGADVTADSVESGYIEAPVRRGAAFIEAVFTEIDDSFTLSGVLTSAPGGKIVADALIVIEAVGSPDIYYLRSGDDGGYSVKLSASRRYEITVKKDGKRAARFDYEYGVNQPELKAPEYALGGGAELNGSPVASDMSVWDESRKDENVYTATRNKTAYFTDGIGTDAVIKFSVVNKTDISAFSSPEELKNSGVEYDPAIGVIVYDGVNSSFIGFWSTGYRIQTSVSGSWSEVVKNENNLTDEYDNLTWNAVGRTYSYMFIREDGAYRLYYFSDTAGDYVKVYDSADKGHVFAVGSGEVAFGIGFTSSKTFEIEFSQLEILLDDDAAELTEKYV